MAWLAVATGANVVGNLLGMNSADKAAKKAAAAVAEGRDYAINKSGLTGYANQGTAASNQQANLLGIGTDPQAGQDAFNQYLASTGYKSQLKAGTDAITSSAAAKGLLNSGATAKGLVKYGQGLGSSYFNNYNAQLGDVAARGQQSSSELARTVTGTAGQESQIAQNNGVAQANGYANIGSTIGDTIGYIGGNPGVMNPAANDNVGGNVGNVYGNTGATQRRSGY